MVIRSPKMLADFLRGTAQETGPLMSLMMKASRALGLVVIIL
jgi:hypothetical protein